MASAAAPRKYGSLFDDEDPVPLGGGSSRAVAASSGDKAAKFANLFGSDTTGALKKYPGLFDDDGDRGAGPTASVPAPPKKSAPPKNLFDDDDDETATAVPAPARQGGVVADRRPAPVPAGQPIAGAGVDDPLADDEDESMFEMKYYEERARRVKLEARILELEKTVRLLKERLGDDEDRGVNPAQPSSDEAALVMNSPENDVSGVEEEVLSVEQLEAASELAAAARERELARRQWRQRQPVSTSARRLGNSQSKLTPMSGNSSVQAMSNDNNEEDCAAAGPVEGFAIDSRRDGIPSSVLSWSSDEDDAAQSATVAPSDPVGLGNAEKGEGPVDTDPIRTEIEIRAQEEILVRRRQKAYRAAMGARPTSRRLGSSKPKHVHVKNTADSTLGADGAKRKSSLGGYEKWSDSDEDCGQEPVVQPNHRRKSREESFDWDSDTEEGQLISLS